MLAGGSSKHLAQAFRRNYLDRRSWTRRASRPYATTTALVGGALALSALANWYLAKKAERDNPPVGRFVQIDGLRLHYKEWGQGEPLILLHGNGSMIEDFISSGLIDKASQGYRVIAFDRPGFGHSERSRGKIWTPQAQADLIHAALLRLGVSRAVVLGHSWGTQVAIALALKYPQDVGALVLASGYYYPTLRADVLALSAPAIPILGDVMRYTVAPLVARAIWPRLMSKIFGPASVPSKFKQGFPKAMAVRPSQLRASGQETALMIPDALAFRGQYHKLQMPAVIVAGEDDRLIDFYKQSCRLHREIKHSVLQRVRGAGHMVHQTAPDRVMAAIDTAADRMRQNRHAGAAPVAT
jgi:pimeloyl-ACP methyl ester carboxylesterase